MRRRQVKTYALNVLIVCLVLIAAACGKEGAAPSSSGEGSTPGQSQSPAPTESKTDPFKLDNPMTVTMLTQETNISNELPIFKWIKDATNITIKASNPAGNYSDGIALTMAGGDIPDIVFMPSVALANRYGQQGALIDFKDHLDKMPNWKKFWDQNPA